ncbi:hypothetical protein GCM10028805_04800 [Spirosoma harenae]
MIRIPLFLIGLFFIVVSCSQRSEKTETTAAGDTTIAETIETTDHPDTLCFLQVTGRDSTKLTLITNDSVVIGELAVLPFEKDRARGLIQGRQKGTQIIADWQRSGEGVTQSYEVVFTLKGDAITWREGERIEKQGKWVLANPDKGYEYVLTKTACQ